MKKTHSTLIRRLRAQPRAGFTLLEVMFATAVLAIAISGAASAMLSAIQLDRVNRETSIATQEARRILEQAQDRNFDELWALYNRDPADDPPAAVAAGTVPGWTFPVPGLTPQEGDLDGFAGEVMMPAVQNVVGVWELREDVVDVALGMPMDLNGDTIPDLLDHSGDYRIIPMRARVQWRGVSGNRTVDLVTIISRR